MYQKTLIVGNLGREPEMRYMPDGTAVTNLNVATNRRWTDKQSGQPVEEVTWFRVNVWGRQAETCNEYLSKGSKVLVEGTLVPDKETGGPVRHAGGAQSHGAEFAGHQRLRPAGGLHLCHPRPAGARQ